MAITDQSAHGIRGGALTFDQETRGVSAEPTGAELTDAECRSWLGGRSEGRLGYLTGRGKRTVVVGFAVADDRLLFRVPEYSEIYQYARGRQIAMLVYDTDPGGTSTRVVVTGVGYLDEHQASDAGDIDPAEHWPAGVSTHLMCLDLANVHGTTSSADPLLADHSLHDRPGNPEPSNLPARLNSPEGAIL